MTQEDKQLLSTAPDKIYLSQGISEDAIKAFSLHLNDNDVEFIRKDALLEWIQEARTIPHENAITRDLAFQEVINKLNSM